MVSSDSGVNVKEELLGLVEELPAVYTRVIKMLPTLQPAISYYKSFVEITCSRNSTSELLPMLCYLNDHGNVTLHQWKTGKAPQIEEQQQDQCSSEATGDELVIDWGEELKETEQESNAEIDFGDIDFNSISLEGITTSDITIEQSATSTSQDTCTDMDTLLANVTTRNKLLDDLMELSGFLGQRITELSSDTDFPLAGQMSDTLQVQSSQSIQDMLSSVSDVIGCITATRTQHLYMIKSSPRYVDRLADDLAHQLQLSRRPAIQITTLTSKREEALEVLGNAEPLLSKLIKETKQLQKQITEEVSKRYNNRMVHLIGEINTI